MIETLLSSGSLNITYMVVLLISFLFAVISLLGAELGDALDFDADIDSDGFDFVNISPFALATFGAGFGVTGLITRLVYDMEAIPSVIWSAALGLIIGGLAQAFFVYVLSVTKSSHFNVSDDAVGRKADVILSIPKDGKGTVAYDNSTGRVTLGARSISGKLIKTGDTVVIEKVVGRVAFVRRDA